MTNRDQNRQFKAAVKEIEKILGEKLSPQDRERLHREITKSGMGFEEIVNTGLALFG